MGYAFVEIGDIETPSDAEAARQNLVKRFNRHLWAVHREFAHENTGGAMKKSAVADMGDRQKSLLHGKVLAASLTSHATSVDGAKRDMAALLTTVASHIDIAVLNFCGTPFTESKSVSSIVEDVAANKTKQMHWPAVFVKAPIEVLDGAGVAKAVVRNKNTKESLPW